MSNGDATGSKPEGIAGGVITSGLIAAAIGIAVVYVLSLFLAFPWTLGQTLVAVAIALAEMFPGDFALRIAVLAGLLSVLAIAARHVLRDMASQLRLILARSKA